MATVFWVCNDAGWSRKGALNMRGSEVLLSD